MLCSAPLQRFAAALPRPGISRSALFASTVVEITDEFDGINTEGTIQLKG